MTYIFVEFRDPILHVKLQPLLISIAVFFGLLSSDPAPHFARQRLGHGQLDRHPARHRRQHRPGQDPNPGDQVVFKLSSVQKRIRAPECQGNCEIVLENGSLIKYLIKGDYLRGSIQLPKTASLEDETEAALEIYLEAAEADPETEYQKQLDRDNPHRIYPNVLFLKGNI